MSDVRKEARLNALREVVQLMGDLECEDAQPKPEATPDAPPASEFSAEDAAALSRLPEEG